MQWNLKRIRIREQALMISGVTAVALLIGVYLYQIHSARRIFVHKIALGMSQADVLTVLGKPIEQYQPGDVMASWGATPREKLVDEAWVYSIFPKMMHHAVLTFRDGVVTKIDFYWT